VTINGLTIEDTVSNATVQPTVIDGPAPEKVGRAGDQQVQQSQGSAPHPPGQRSTPGRRPLFRT
jgi:hypothetical protein